MVQIKHIYPTRIHASHSRDTRHTRQLKGGKTPTGDGWGKGQSVAPSRSNSPPHFDGPSRMGSRRPSRVPRQHSYDDEVLATGPQGGSQTDLGLMSIPTMTRRYDIWTEQYLRQHQKRHFIFFVRTGRPLTMCYRPVFWHRPASRQWPSSNNNNNKSVCPSNRQ